MSFSSTIQHLLTANRIRLFGQPILLFAAMVLIVGPLFFGTQLGVGSTTGLASMVLGILVGIAGVVWLLKQPE